MTVNLRQNLNIGTMLGDPRSTDEYASHGPSGQTLHLEIGLEGTQLAPEGVALGADIHDPQVIAVKHDQARARAEDGHSGRSAVIPPLVNAGQPSQGLGQTLALDAQSHGCGLPARYHQTV